MALNGIHLEGDDDHIDDHVLIDAILSRSYTTLPAATGVAATDTAILQDALDAGGLLLIPHDSTYLVNETLAPTVAGTMLLGFGPTSVIKAANGLDSNIFGASALDGLTLRDFAVDGNKANNAGTKSAVILEECTNFRVQRLRIRDMFGQGVGIGSVNGASSDGTVEGCTITGGTSNHIDINGSARVRVLNNHITGTLNAEDGIFVGHGLTQDSLIQGNVIRDANFGIDVSNTVFDSVDPDVQRLRILGNIVRGCQADGIRLWGAENSIVAMNQCYDNNIGETGEGAGVRLSDGDGRGCTHTLIYGNRCSGANYGIYADSLSAASDSSNTAIGNDCTGNLIDEYYGIPYFWTDETGAFRWSAGGNTLHLSLDPAGQLYVPGEAFLNGNLRHGGGDVGFYNTAPIAKQTVTGSRGGNAALASLLTKLAALGLITDSSS